MADTQTQTPDIKKPEGPEPGPGSVMFADPSSAPPRADSPVGKAPEAAPPGAGAPAPQAAAPVEPVRANTSVPQVVVNPAPEEIRFKIVVAAPLEKVFKALIEPAQLTKWFCRAAVIEPKAGGKFNVSLVPGRTADWTIKAIVPNQTIDIVRPETLSFSVQAEADGRTRVRVASQMHSDEASSTNEQILWSVHLVYLKAWLEHGVDLRETDLSLTWKNGFVNGLEPG